MATSVLSFLKRNLGKAFLSASLLATGVAQGQNGNPIPGYTYLGSCIVNGQPHYYYASTTQATWPAANAAATALGGGTGYLATLTSQAENDCVFTNYVNYLTSSGLGRPTFGDSYGDPRNPWIGLTDQSSENNFQWANGENCSDFRNWDYGNLNSPADGDMSEPNDQFIPASSNGEDYVQLLTFLPAPGEPTVVTPPSPLPGDAAPGGLGRKHAGYWNDWFNIESQFYIVEFGANSCLGNEGCTPGFWKNHTDVWPATYSANSLASTYFTFPNGAPMYSCNLTSFGGKTLLQSLQGGGGSGLNGAVTILVRAAVAGLLNAVDPRVDYALSPLQITTQVNAALATCDRATILALATKIDGYNNGGCPIDAHGNETSRAPLTELAVSDNAFAVSGYPNPSRGSFSIQVAGSSTESVTVKVTDMTGRLIEQRTNVPANQVLQIGSTYRAGMYYVEVAQGGVKKQLKLVKQ